MGKRTNSQRTRSQCADTHRHGFRGIFLSGYGTEQDIARSREAGFMTHLTKPVQAQTLYRVLQELGRE